MPRPGATGRRAEAAPGPAEGATRRPATAWRRPDAGLARPAPGAPEGPPAAMARQVRGPSSVAGLVIVATALLVATLVTFGVFLPALGQLGGTTAEGSPLPAAIDACGTTWTRDPLTRRLTGDEVFARTGAEPVVVAAVPSASCPPELAADPAITEVYLRTTDGAFVAYAASGAP